MASFGNKQTRQISWDVITFQSGFTANLGTIPPLVGKNDVIFSDGLNHASIIDGCRLSGAKIVAYEHNDPGSLEDAIKEHASNFRRALIVTDGVFSMDGDIAPLPALYEVAQKYDILFMVDDAHGEGVLGKGGRGIVDHFNLHGKIDVEVGRMSKAFGVVGGMVAGKKEIIEWLKQRGRPFLFAEIIERFSDELPMHGERNTRLDWLESFPAQVLLDRPGLGLVYAWALFLANQLDRAESQLDQLAPFVQTVPSLLGEHYVIRVMIAARRLDLSAFHELARQALSRVPPEEASPRSRILLTLGVAYEEMSGDIAAAKSAFREAYELGKALPSASAVGNAPLPLTALAYLADYEWLYGNLRGASHLYEQALELADQWGG